MEQNTVVSQPQQTVPVANATGNNYAGVLIRWVAIIIDGILIGMVGFVISLVFLIPSIIAGAAAGSSSSSQGLSAVGGIFNFLGWIVQLVVTYGYYVYFTGKDGQTIGKKAMKIKVVRADGLPMNMSTALIREVPGKIVDVLALGLGYLWAIWDKDKQTFHDKIANTFVVKV